MSGRSRRKFAALCGLLLIVVCAVAVIQLPIVLAGALLHPARTDVYHPMPAACVEREFAGDGVALGGWHCRAVGDRRASLVYLHGVGDNRASGAGIVSRFTKLGFDVIAYDSRGHGESEGDVCTYGYAEKRDLHRVIAALEPGPIVLLGSSLGAAVALQGAVGQPGIVAVVAAEVFSDLETIVRDRLPWLLPDWLIRRAFDTAEGRGGFDARRISPVDAAGVLRVPVLLIHGAEDRDTSPEHSRRVFAALHGPKRLVIVERAGHGRSLSDPEVWEQINEWIDGVLTAGPANTRQPAQITASAPR